MPIIFEFKMSAQDISFRFGTERTVSSSPRERTAVQI
jgi:hypothetical protein